MVFANDVEVCLRAAVALVNTAKTSSSDSLQTLVQLDAFYQEFDYTGHYRRDRHELDEVSALRPTLRSLLTADRDQAASHINRILADARAVPYLVRHEPLDWHVHAVDPERPLATRIAVETAMAMIEVVRLDEMSRLGICRDEGCNGVVLDLTRNRSRRFCSTTCSNRAAVAAYRARRDSNADNTGTTHGRTQTNVDVTRSARIGLDGNPTEPSSA